MKLLLVDDESVIQGTYYINHDEKKPVVGEFHYILPIMYVKKHPMGAANDLGVEIINDVLALDKQGIK